MQLCHIYESKSQITVTRLLNVEEMKKTKGVAEGRPHSNCLAVFKTRALLCIVWSNINRAR